MVRQAGDEPWRDRSRREADPHRRSPYDDFGHPETDFKGYDQSVARFAQWVPTLAKERNAQFVDFHAPVSVFIRRVAKTEPAAVPTIIPDAIHPGPNGHLVMAFALLRGWNVESVVSRVSIDAASRRVDGTQNARVTGLKDLQWKQKDGSLPFPNLPEHAVAWRNDADLGGLNQQVVVVKGLAREATRWRLTARRWLRRVPKPGRRA